MPLNLTIPKSPEKRNIAIFIMAQFIYMKPGFFTLLFVFALINNFIGQTTVKIEAEGQLRKEANVSSEVLKIIPAGEEVKVIAGPKLKYYYVEYKNKEGYLNEVYFSSETINALPKLPPVSITRHIKNYVEAEINIWQKKGEFEKVSDYEKRINEQTRQAKIQELSKTIIQVLKEDTRKKINNSTFSLGEYDSENESFLIKTNDLGNFAIKVPIETAPSFKSSWKTMNFRNIDFSLRDEQFFISTIEIFFPDKKQSYFFDSKNAVTYSNVKIEYDFPPLEISVNSKDNKADQPKNVSYGKPDIDIDIPNSAAQYTNYFAVIIGNEDYKNEIKVNYALNDSKSVYEYFNKTLGIPVNNIHQIQNATFGQMLTEIEWLNNISKAFNGKARLYFYYAGHGVPNEQTKSAYLLPVDGNASITQTAIRTEDLYSKLTQYKPELATVFLDACFSGAAREGMLADGRGVKVKPKSDYLQGNILVFSASSNDETAHPFKEKQHGLFTYFFLKKIKETKGNLSYGDLSEYIATNVNQQSIVVNQKNQTPQSNISAELQESWKKIKLK